MKVSYSSTQKYLACPKMYELHYIQKLRPTWTSSALLFGDALDKSLNELLLKTENDPYETFLKSWSNGIINKQPIYIPTSTQVLYANKDYEPSILTQKDYDAIAERITKGEVKKFSYEDLLAKKKQTSWDSFTDDEKSYYNLVNWYCMASKAKYMIQAYKDKVLPLITKVHCVQKEIKVDNGNGDDLSGFIDLIADVEGHGTVILDNKTSARDYEWDSPSKSSQLSLYVHMEGTNYNTQKGGFLVMKKNLNYNKVKTCKECGHVGKGSHKTCDNIIDAVKPYRCNGEWTEVSNPEAEVQVLIQEIPKRMELDTIENIDLVTKAINTQIFPKNTNTCENYFGSKCTYFDYCKSGKKKGLVCE